MHSLENIILENKQDTQSPKVIQTNSIKKCFLLSSLLFFYFCIPNYRIKVILVSLSGKVILFFHKKTSYSVLLNNHVAEIRCFSHLSYDHIMQGWIKNLKICGNIHPLFCAIVCFMVALLLC